MMDPLDNQVQLCLDLAQYIHVSICWQLNHARETDQQLKQDSPLDKAEEAEPVLLTSSLIDLQDTCPICLEPFLLDTESSTLGSQGITPLHPSDISVHLITETPAISAHGISPKPSVLTPCFHRFHVACITDAMAGPFACGRPPVCPLCREPLVQDPSSSHPRSAHIAEPAWHAAVEAARHSDAPRAPRVGALRRWWAACWRHQRSLVGAVYVALIVGLFLGFHV